MFLLLGAMALVLLIACANLSNLALARSATRHRDMAICLALGAGRWGLARQQLAEVVWLALAGGGLGLLVAYVGLPALVSLVPPIANTLGLTPTIGWRVVLWAGGSHGLGVVVALLPVFQATRTTSNDALKTEGRGLTSSRGALRLRHGLIVGEIALAVVLLAGAGLFVRSFVNVQRVPLGFDADRMLTMRLTLPASAIVAPRSTTSSSACSTRWPRRQVCARHRLRRSCRCRADSRRPSASTASRRRPIRCRRRSSPWSGGRIFHAPRLDGAGPRARRPRPGAAPRVIMVNQAF